MSKISAGCLNEEIHVVKITKLEPLSIQASYLTSLLGRLS